MSMLLETCCWDMNQDRAEATVARTFCGKQSSFGTSVLSSTMSLPHVPYTKGNSQESNMESIKIF